MQITFRTDQGVLVAGVQITLPPDMLPRLKTFDGIVVKDAYGNGKGYIKDALLNQVLTAWENELTSTGP
jgi:hypothetical protein